MRTGASAALDLGLNLLSSSELDAYIDAAQLEVLRRRYHLRPTQTGNVLFRVTPKLAPDWPSRRVAPLSAVALDLSDDEDPRSRETGQELLARYG